MKALFAINTLLLLSTALQAQVADSAKVLQEAQIIAKAKAVVDIGKTTQNIQPNLINPDVGSLLQVGSSVHIKSYGPGMLSSLAIRGTGASHSPILWHGLNIQNGQNSQQDLSLLHSFLFNDISLTTGTQNHLSTGGILGGRMELKNNLSPHEKNLMLGADIGSFGTKRLRIGADWSEKKLSNRFRIIHQQAENNFSYTNRSLSTPKTETMTHAGLNSLSVLNETGYQISAKWKGKLNVWHQKTNRQIPPTLLAPSVATQYDETLRLNAGLEYADSLNQLKINSGLFNEHMLYRDPARNLIGRNHAMRWINQVSYGRIIRSTFWQVGFQQQLDQGFSSEYASEKNSLNDLSAYLLGVGTLKRLTYKVDIRQQYRDGQQQAPGASLGLEYQINSKNQVLLHAARISRLPGLNDLYWNPGGNPDLKPEVGSSFEMGYKGQVQKAQTLIKYHLNLYYSYIQNWIIWLPDGGFWTAQNLQEVHSRGSEWEFHFLHQPSKKQLLDIQYGGSFTMASNQKGKDLNKQLIYVPFWKNFLALGYTLKDFKLSYRHAFTGGRYTSSDNISYLPPYHTGDVDLSYSNPWFRCGIAVQNIWNESYESIEWRPMPGRYFQLSFDYLIPFFKKKPK